MTPLSSLSAALRKVGLRLGIGAGAWTANDSYATDAPSRAQTADVFRGEWISRLPIAGYPSGNVDLFDDYRIRWLLDELPVASFDILELGPLEGGHTASLLDAGAASVTAIEGHRQAYLRCLVVQQLLGLDRARFELGDIGAYLAHNERRFDLAVASGVFYHFADPLAILLDLARSSERIFIWSHFADADAMPAGDPRRRPFTGETRIAERDGERLTYHVRSYLGTQRRNSFCGGRESAAVWLESGEVATLLERRGFAVTRGVEEPGHPSGPALCLLAVRR